MEGDKSGRGCEVPRADQEFRPFPEAEVLPEAAALGVGLVGHNMATGQAEGAEPVEAALHQLAAQPLAAEFSVHGQVVEEPPPAIVAAQDRPHQPAVGLGHHAEAGIPLQELPNRPGLVPTSEAHAFRALPQGQGRGVIGRLKRAESCVCHVAKVEPGAGPEKAKRRLPEEPP